MTNKSPVVSEPIYRPAPFVPGEHYIEAEVSEMPRVLDYAAIRQLALLTRDAARYRTYFPNIEIIVPITHQK